MNNFKPASLTFNFKARAYESVNLAELSDNQLREYIPQEDAVQGIFGCHLDLGEKPLIAYLKTLEAVAAAYRKANES